MLAKRLFLSLASLSLTACAFPGRIHDIAVDYNEAVAQSANEITFLNIVRASERQPMHFTSISSLTGSMSVKGTGKFGATLNGSALTENFDDVGALTTSGVAKAKEVYSPTIDASVTSSPSFNVAVHDTQTFYNGIITSVTPGMIAHFLHQGWRDDLLSYVYIERVNFYARDDLYDEDTGEVSFKKGALVTSIGNDPDNAASAARFAEFVSCFPIAPAKTKKTETKLFSLSDFTAVALKDVYELSGSKFDVTPVRSDSDLRNLRKNARYILRRSGGADTLTVKYVCDVDKKQETIEALAPVTQNLIGGVKNLNGAETVISLSELFPFEIAQSAQIDFNGDVDQDVVSAITVGPYQVDIVLRSIQGVFYYLGEYMRARAHCPYALSNGQPLLIVHKEDALSPCVSKDTEQPRTILSARLDGARYWVPISTDAQPHRSMQIISLAQQLLNLQKTAEERPTTQTVRVVE